MAVKGKSGIFFNSLSDSPTKWLNTQIIRRQIAYESFERV